MGVLSFNIAGAGGLNDVKKAGILRHLGIPYANFVTHDHDGLDIALIKAFAKNLGVKYQFVESTWQTIIADLSGKKVKPAGNDIQIIGKTRIKGDIISTGFTVLPWRKKIVDFSAMTFPSEIWLIARSDTQLTPISPTGVITKDIDKVKKLLNGFSVLGLKDSCLDPNSYGIRKTGAKILYFSADHDLSGMIPSVIAEVADATLMDVPVALVALAKWPGKIKVIGPLSQPQDMACAFSKSSPKLKQAFDIFFEKFKTSGEYRKLVETYYPSVFTYYPNFL
jgi:ABC-type amino acid transport substrate-binding protein